MKLTKNFFAYAVPHATFLIDNVEPTDAQWDQLQQRDNVTISIDSRTIQAGELFVPLKGPSFDGHDFIQSALENGACGALVAKRWQETLQQLPAALRAKKLFIMVDDVDSALITLAKAWRSRLTCPVVGITGSVGKTTTKEMLRSILTSAGRSAYVSYKNYNNIIGVCFNILQAPETSSVVVIEMGINDVGEMLQLADVVRPTIGLITGLAHAHLAGLGNSLELVSQEKRQLFAFFTPENIGLVCGDQPLLTTAHYAHPVAQFGCKAKNAVRAKKIQRSCDVSGVCSTTFVMTWFGAQAHVKLFGSHKGFVNNALAASAIAYFLSIPLDNVVQGLADYQGSDGRFQIKKLRNNKGILLNDCYNANPESMKAALEALTYFSSHQPRIAILGDMLEMGPKELHWHRQIGRFIARHNIGLASIVLVGQRAKVIGSMLPSSVHPIVVDDWQGAQDALQTLLAQPGFSPIVLVKASHGMNLHKLVQAVCE